MKTSALDPRSEMLIDATLAKLAKAGDMTVVAVSTNFANFASFAAAGFHAISQLWLLSSSLSILQVSHHLSRLQHVDQIVVFGKAGTPIVEKGSFAELAAKPHGQFAADLRLQSLVSGSDEEGFSVTPQALAQILGIDEKVSCLPCPAVSASSSVLLKVVCARRRMATFASAICRSSAARLCRCIAVRLSLARSVPNLVAPVAS